MGFSSQVDRFIERFKERANATAQFYAMSAGEYAVDVTPVVTGKLRGGWYLRINSGDSLPSLPVDPSGSFTKALIRATAAKVRWGDVVELVNDVSYSFYVDQGTSKFEGHHMIERTVDHLQNLKVNI